MLYLINFCEINELEIVIYWIHYISIESDLDNTFKLGFSRIRISRIFLAREGLNFSRSGLRIKNVAHPYNKQS